MDYTKLQDQVMESDFSDENGENNFEEARGKKRKARQEKRQVRKAGRSARIANKRAKRQNKRAKRVEKKNPARAARLRGRATANKAKATEMKKTVRSIKKAPIKKKPVKKVGKSVVAQRLERENGEMVDPIISQSGEELYTPQIVEPIEMETTDYEQGGVQNEVIEPEITDSGEVMTPEILETNEEPIDNEDGSISVGDERIETEMSEDGEAYEPEVVDEEEGADGETVYKILRYNKIPATRNADGDVIMPYKMADGSVVLTDEIYSSATGEIYTNADGDTVVKNAKTVKGAKESDININLPENKWAKYATYGLAIVGLAAVAVYGYKVYKQYNK